VRKNDQGRSQGRARIFSALNAIPIDRSIDRYESPRYSSTSRADHHSRISRNPFPEGARSTRVTSDIVIAPGNQSAINNAYRYAVSAANWLTLDPSPPPFSPAPQCLHRPCCACCIKRVTADLGSDRSAANTTTSGMSPEIKTGIKIQYRFPLRARASICA